MLTNYIKTAFRTLVRHRFFSIINIFGLAVSMSIGMVIIMLVADQMMYDRYNTKRDRIFRVNSMPTNKNGEQRSETATTALPLKQELLENYVGVEKAVRLVRGFGNSWIELDQNVNIPVAGYFADPEVLDVLEYELELGDPKTALKEPFSVVLTYKAAKKLFRQDNPIGETFKVGDQGLYKVTGVLRETAHKSHIVFDALASMSTIKSLAAIDPNNHKQKEVEDWYTYTTGWVYILLEKGKTEEDIKPQLDRIYQKHYGSLTKEDEQSRVKFKLQPLMSITPGEFINNPIGPFLPWIFIYFFAALAGIVMLTSCFNFTNLSIARSLTRAREIGVRKVTGALRRQIFAQFLSESIVIALFSLVAAVLLLILSKPLLMQLSFARILKWDLEINYVVVTAFVAFAVVTGALAGMFPAVVMSRFQPVQVLKGLNTMKLFSKMGLRKGLLVAQFSFSLIFILTVIIVFKQLELFTQADHGFDMENKLVVQINGTSSSALKNELLRYANVENVSISSHLPAAGTQYGNGFKKSMDEKDWTLLYYFSVDEDYLKNLNLQLLTGRFFDHSDSLANKNFIVINEQAVQVFHLGTPHEAIGREIISQQDSSRKQIIGVVKNYNHQMLMEKIEAMALVSNPSQFSLIQVKYFGPYPDAVKTVETAWAKINPAMKIDYRDFKTEIHKLYDIFFGDLVNILGVISGLAIMISCLGLLGMATYSTETRIKEVSIRKILGCSEGSIMYLLSKGFLLIVVLAVVIAVPLTLFVNNLWLEKLAYHITVSPLMILSGIGILAAFAVVTIGSQTWRASRTNPVDNLRG